MYSFNYYRKCSKGAHDMIVILADKDLELSCQRTYTKPQLTAMSDSIQICDNYGNCERAIYQGQDMTLVFRNILKSIFIPLLYFKPDEIKNMHLDDLTAFVAHPTSFNDKKPVRDATLETLHSNMLTILDKSKSIIEFCKDAVVASNSNWKSTLCIKY